MDTFITEIEADVAALAQDFPGMYIREWGEPIKDGDWDDEYDYEVVTLTDPRLPAEAVKRAIAVEQAMPIVQFYLMIEREEVKPVKKEVKPVEVNVPWREMAVVLGFFAWSVLKVVAMVTFALAGILFAVLANDPILVAVTKEGAHVVCYSWLHE